METNESNTMPKQIELIAYYLRLNNVIEGGWCTYFLLPIFGPLVGSVVAGWLYMICAGYQIPGPVSSKSQRRPGSKGLFEENENLVRERNFTKPNIVA